MHSSEKTVYICCTFKFGEHIETTNTRTGKYLEVQRDKSIDCFEIRKLSI